MMHPTAATRYLHMQIPVVNDFVDYLDKKREADGLVPNLYEDLFKYTMEGEIFLLSAIDIRLVIFRPKIVTYHDCQHKKLGTQRQYLRHAFFLVIYEATLKLWPMYSVCFCRK